MNQHFDIKNIHYLIKQKELSVIKKKGVYYIKINLGGITEDKTVDSEIRQAYMYFDTYLNTGVANLSELEGKEFSMAKPNAGTLCILEHEYNRQSKVKILSVNDVTMAIHWFGLTDIFWDDEYGSNVPFDIEFTAEYTSELLRSP